MIDYHQDQNMVKKNQIYKKAYFKIVNLPKYIKTCSIDFYRKFSYIFLFSKNFFFKYKFNKKVLVKSTNNKILFSGSDYSIFITYMKIIDNLCNSIYRIKSIELYIYGLGFKYRFKNKFLYFIFGFSHLIKIFIPGNIYIKFNKKFIILKSFDKLLLKDFIIKLKRIRPLDPYKAKGVRLKNEVINIKKGKQSSY